MANTNPPRENQADVPSVTQSCPAKSPASHVRIASSVCSSRIRIAAVIEDTNADSATPHKVTFIGVNPERPAEESSNINRNNNAPPVDASSGRPTGKASPSAVAATTARAAPAFKPKICGSPNGLRMTACNKAPATPREAPVSNAAANRGKRSLTITL